MRLTDGRRARERRAAIDAEEYIEQYGAALSEADKRYIRAFGAPTISTGTAHNPSTPGMSIGDDFGGEAHRARMDRMDNEAGL